MQNNANSAPAQFQATISVIKRFRFKTGSPASVTTVTTANLVAFQSLMLSTNFAQPLFTKTRLISVEVFGPMSSTLEPVTVSVEFNQMSSTVALSSNSKIHTDTSMSSVNCAHVYAKPSKDSTASKWQLPLATGSDLFTVNTPANSIVDIVMEACYNDGEVPPTQVAVPVPVTIAGSIGVFPPTSSWRPLGLPSLI